MKKKYINFAIVALLVIATVCGSILVFYDYSSMRNQKNYVALSQAFRQAAESGVASSDASAGVKRLKIQNPDLFAWLKIAGTEIEYPVMQCKNDAEFYLRHDFQKKYSIAGTPFADARCSTGSQNIIIYGHNMKDGSMFSDLLQYRDPAVVETYPLIQLVTETETREYRIIAVIETNGYDNNDFDFYAYIEDSDHLRLPEYTEIAMRESMYKLWFDLEKNRNLISLSTCSDHEKNGRLLIVAAQI